MASMAVQRAFKRQASTREIQEIKRLEASRQRESYGILSYEIEVDSDNLGGDDEYQNDGYFCESCQEWHSA